jgi:hypothetical protein
MKTYQDRIPSIFTENWICEYYRDPYYSANTLSSMSII